LKIICIVVCCSCDIKHKLKEILRLIRISLCVPIANAAVPIIMQFCCVGLAFTVWCKAEALI
jgi:hypothetical protein